MKSKYFIHPPGGWLRYGWDSQSSHQIGCSHRWFLTCWCMLVGIIWCYEKGWHITIDSWADICDDNTNRLQMAQYGSDHWSSWHSNADFMAVLLTVLDHHGQVFIHWGPWTYKSCTWVTWDFSLVEDGQIVLKSVFSTAQGHFCLSVLPETTVQQMLGIWCQLP